MADNSDVPPLEDMTDVVKRAETIREAREQGQANGRLAAKERAKVKKNVTAKAVRPEEVTNAGSGDYKVTSINKPEEGKISQAATTPTPASNAISTSSSSTSSSPKAASKPASGGMFGGMKKGFLFGGPAKTPSSIKTANSDTTSSPKVKPTAPVKQNPPVIKPAKEDIPYISPKTGKTESGLTLNEVQEAMSEAKGLLDNQDWINDDLLNKVEKNETLLRRFADPHFMEALGEFQTNPQAAMEKYKGNKEVEKFLMDFCGLLGDHFNNLGNTSSSSTAAAKSSKPGTNKSQTPTASNKPSKAKITEVTDTENLASRSERSKACEGDSKSPKIVEISDTEKSVDSQSGKLDGAVTMGQTQIHIHDPSNQADIQEMPPMEDAEVKKALDDPKVMEILLDPKIMNLIQMLRSDPEKAQRIADKADSDLRDKIRFLVSKGLLQIQSG